MQENTTLLDFRIQALMMMSQGQPNTFPVSHSVTLLLLPVHLIMDQASPLFPIKMSPICILYHLNHFYQAAQSNNGPLISLTQLCPTKTSPFSLSY